MMNPDLKPSPPQDLSAPLVWDAFDHITQRTDWRPRIASREPLTFDLEYDDAFGSDLLDGTSWRPSLQARHWIANRIQQMVLTDFGKTSVRRSSLQVPKAGHSEDDLSKAVKERVVLSLRADLVRHFDQSLPEWEREAFDHMARMTDALDQDRFRRFVGLDQVVPIDVMRKAVKYVLHRLPWGIVEEAGRPKFWGDHIAEALRRRRFPHDDSDRARALIMRAVHALLLEHEARLRAEPELTPTNKFAIADTIRMAFEHDGVWGPIHLVLATDRINYGLAAPDLDDPRMECLIARQARRLLLPCGSRNTMS